MFPDEPYSVVFSNEPRKDGFHMFHSDLEKLRSAIEGQVFLPTEPGHTQYQPWTLCQSQRHEDHPMLVRATTVEDIERTMAFAHANGLKIAVHTTGHGIPAIKSARTLILAPALQSVTRVHIDPETQTATVPAGSLWLDVIRAALPHNLVGLNGLFPWVGAVGGYTLFGGIGATMRKRGLATDSILSMDVVTADGIFRHLNSTQNKDLFWAFCGGGGNFGIVTSMKLRLFPLLPIKHRLLVFPIELAEAPEYLSMFHEWTDCAPSERTSLIAFKRYGTNEANPNLRGKLCALVELYWCGDSDGFSQQTVFWKNCKPAHMVSDDLQILPEDTQPLPSYATMTGGQLFTELSDGLITILSQYGTANTILTDLIVRHIGGAMAQIPDTNAISYRQTRYSLSMYTFRKIIIGKI